MGDRLVLVNVVGPVYLKSAVRCDWPSLCGLLSLCGLQSLYAFSFLNFIKKKMCLVYMTCKVGVTCSELLSLCDTLR